MAPALGPLRYRATFFGRSATSSQAKSRFSHPCGVTLGYPKSLERDLSNEAFAPNALNPNGFRDLLDRKILKVVMQTRTANVRASPVVPEN